MLHKNNILILKYRINDDSIGQPNHGKGGDDTSGQENIV